MNTCTHCRMEVPNTAQKCPYCLENPYDGNTDAWVWILIALFLGYLLFG